MATAPRRTDPSEAPPGRRVDRRFERLLAPAAWTSLPTAVRRRFSEHPTGTGSSLYAGEVARTALSRAGRVFGQLARLIGAPLPLTAGGRVAACVVVTEEQAGRQRWTRLYARPGRESQLIHPTKGFAGPAGLEECVGCEVGMRLRLSVEQRALVFRSAGFFVRIGALSLSACTNGPRLNP